MKQHPIITKKPSPALLKMQEQVEFEFIMAVASMRLRGLRKLLHEEGRFFGGYYKYQALHFFKTQFEEWKRNQKHIHKIDHYVAVGKHCGKSVLEFQNGEFPTTSDEQQKFSILLTITEEGITGIELCTTYVTENEFAAAALQN